MSDKLQVIRVRGLLARTVAFFLPLLLVASHLLSRSCQFIATVIALLAASAPGVSIGRNVGDELSHLLRTQIRGRDRDSLAVCVADA